MSYYNFDFSDATLAAAERITLKDLLMCPVFSSFVVSACSSALQSSHKFDLTKEEDEYTTFKVHKLLHSIPYSDRQACFDEVKQLKKEYFEEKQERNGSTSVKRTLDRTLR